MVLITEAIKSEVKSLRERIREEEIQIIKSKEQISYSQRTIYEIEDMIRRLTL